MTRFIKRGGKIWVRVFPDKPITKKPQETRMGKGKGAPEAVGVRRPAGPDAVRDGRRDRERGARGDAAGGRRSCRSGRRFATRFAQEKSVMKAGGVPRPGGRRAAAAREAISTISCSGCGSRSRWGSSRRRDKMQVAAPRPGAGQDGAAREGDGVSDGQPRQSDKLGVVVSDKMQKTSWSRSSGRCARAVRQDPAADVEVHGARRGERGEGRRHGGDHRDAAAQPPQALGADARRARRP